MKKSLKLITLFLAVFGLSIFVLGYALNAAPPPPKVCGDGKIQTPNDAGINEQCDDDNRTDGDGCNDAQTDGCRFVCGDGAVQSPNGEDPAKYEKCDLAGRGYCFNDAGQADPHHECLVDGDCGGSRCLKSCTDTCGEKLLGWAWSWPLGWLSLNKDNCYHLDPTVEVVCESGSNIDYYTQIDSDINNSLKGWAWSENIGWVCFGSTCSQDEICSFAQGSCNPVDYGLAAPAGGWLAKVDDFNTPNSPVRGWGKILINGDGGFISFNCSNDNSCGSINYGLKFTADFYPPNGDVGNKVLRKTLFDFAWNDSTTMSGLGWIYFTPQLIEKPWLETRLGDIYAKSGIVTPRPTGYFNATYRILGYGEQGSIEALSSGREGFNWLDPRYGPIDFPTPRTRYSNILGKLDVDGLICAPQTGKQSCRNKYDKEVIVYKSNQSNQLLNDLDSDQGLGGKIYYIESGLTVDKPITFKNADKNSYLSGAGTIVIDGNLIINDNLNYDSTDDLTKFRNLASVAWIVKGDITVSPSVQNLVGAFIVLGEAGINCPNNGCGIFSSGSSANPFNVSGLIMARQFNFQRQGIREEGGRKVGSELIIYDGRLLANTPAGLEDFASALPIWRQGVFSP